ncbi:hypothetical protein TNCV_30811 [Trichonephila clavipes]|nr:hypothetical protein TNCV_30811 [Trichonephila clavipes]
MYPSGSEDGRQHETLCYLVKRGHISDLEDRAQLPTLISDKCNAACSVYNPTSLTMISNILATEGFEIVVLHGGRLFYYFNTFVKLAASPPFYHKSSHQHFPGTPQ